MLSFLSKYKYTLIGALLGAVAGYLYWQEYACNGTCMITSQWERSTAYGAVMGLLLAGILQKEPKA